VSDAKPGFVKVNVVGVRVEMPTNQPIILLQDQAGDRYLPIWVGAVEATAIAFAQQGIKPPRPLTHDLFTDVLKTLQANLQEVRITSLKDGVFYAEIEFGGGQVLSSRQLRRVIAPMPANSLPLVYSCNTIPHRSVII